jgi:hypothetical protein
MFSTRSEFVGIRRPFIGIRSLQSVSIESNYFVGFVQHGLMPFCDVFVQHESLDDFSRALTRMALLVIGVSNRCRSVIPAILL